MIKKICLVTLLLFVTFSFAGEYDKDIVVKNQTRNDKVKTVFREMMNAYEEEDIGQFFSFVSEDRFQQDYMAFYDAIDEDMRIYDILSIDTWVNKTTEAGVKRFLEVQWEKRYESSKPVQLNRADLQTSDEYEIKQRGTTEFLFDEINGKYKLIKIAGNNFWGGSLKEWTDEVGDIAGQESKEIVGDNVNGEYQGGGDGTPSVMLPDLVIENFTCPNGWGGAMPVSFDLVNNGLGSTTAGTIEYTHSGFSMPFIREYNGDLLPGESVTVTGIGNCYGGETITVDPNNLIEESDDTNNEVTFVGGA